jgi:DNA helicase-2/ATP-dependent DNA helicase PcrA
MLLLDERYPTLERHALNTSYRCPPEVVKAATRLIGHNRRRFDKTIRPYDAHSRAGRQRSIRVEACGSLESQATAAVLALQKHDESDAVLLARSSRLLRIAAVECVKRGVAFWTPMKSVIGVGGAHAVLCSYLRALSNPRGVEAADVDLMCRAPNRYLPRGRAKQVAGRLHRGASFCEAFKDAGGMEQWRQRALDDAARLFDDLCLEPDAAVVIRRLRNDGGLDDYCSSRERLKKTEHVELEVLESAEREAGGLSVTELLDSWERLDQQLAQMNTKGGYELNTIHGAKGREWECVVILGCDEKQLPHHYALSPKLTKTRVLATGADDDIESERRLAYVALTRTTDELFLLHTTGAASRFLAEAGLLAPAPTSPPIGSTKTRGVPARHVPRMRYGSQKRGQRSSSQVKAWTSGQDAWLRSMHSAQMDQRTIAKKLDRPEQDVANRLRELGLN